MTKMADREERRTAPARSMAPFLRRHRLKLILLCGGAAALALACALTLLTIGYAGGHGLKRTFVPVPLVVLAGMWAVRSQSLLLSRISAVRVLETTRIARTIAIQAALMLIIDRIGEFQFAIKQIALAAALGFVFLMSSRSLHRSWLGAARKKGAFCRRIVLIGIDPESARPSSSCPPRVSSA